MAGTFVKIGMALEGLGTGLWCLSSSGEQTWFPLALGVIGVVPLVRQWADAVFDGASPADDDQPDAAE